MRDLPLCACLCSFFIGSEGILGIITEAWIRVQARPRFRASKTVLFDEWADGVAAVHAISQSGLFPANCRYGAACTPRL